MKRFPRNSVLAKAGLLTLLMLLLSIPLGQIEWLVQGRGASRDQAAAELASAHAGPQTLVGPVLVVPYVERWTETQLDDAGKFRARVPRVRQRLHLVPAERLEIGGAVIPEVRRRGIFDILFYEMRGNWRGRFAAFDPARVARSDKDVAVEFGVPVVVFSLSDVRGLQGSPTLTVQGAPQRFVAGLPTGAEGSALPAGVQAPLEGAALAAYERRQPMEFEFKATVIGQERLQIAPVADDTQAKIGFAWPHLSFGGRFLASQRVPLAGGVTEARWAVSSLASGAGRQLAASLEGASQPPSTAGGHPMAGAAASMAPHRPATSLDTFDITLIQPQNTYSLTDRAVKYGALIIGLVLMATFMFELFRRLRLHPVQYALVGLSLAIFFLLLLALSEKLPFAIAYGTAATGSVLLLGVYFAAVLGGARRGAALAAFVAALYGALYGLLVSEGNALLMGSLLVFAMLAVLMLATRRVDWYGLSGGNDSGGDGGGTTGGAGPGDGSGPPAGPAAPGGIAARPEPAFRMPATAPWAAGLAPAPRPTGAA